MINDKELKSMLEKNRDIPYPHVPKLYPNKRYCNMIYESLGGDRGELTAITQYMYEHMSFRKNQGISDILKEIAIEEMHHLDILGEIIVNLGEKPIYKNGKEKIWTANNVWYDMCSLQEAIKNNIKAEEEAISGYRNILRYTNNMYLRRIYERIILDEITHLEIFKKIQKELK